MTVIKNEFANSAIIDYNIKQKMRKNKNKRNLIMKNNANIFESASSGNLKGVQQFVDRDANVNAKDKKGFTPLMKASRNGHLEVVEYLVEQGADINTLDADGRTAWMTASRYGYLDIVEFLVDSGVEINTQDNFFKSTALMFAAYNGNTEVVKYLVAKGADVNTKNEDGETALDIADERKHAQVVEYLKDL